MIQRWRLAARWHNTRAVLADAWPAGAMSATGHATVSAVGSVANPTIEQRLNAVETTVMQLRTDLIEKTQTITTSVEAVKQSVQREAEERGAAIRDVLRQLQEVSAGGLFLQGIGLGWLVVGVLFTSLPNELAAVLKTFL